MSKLLGSNNGATNARAKYLSPQSGLSNQQSLGKLVQAGLTLNRIFEVIHTHTRRKEVNRIAEENRQKIEQNIISQRQEDTRLGTLKDAEELGYRDDFSGPLLGFKDGYPLFLPNDFHISTCAFPGSGKTTTLTIPNIISLGMGKSPESIVVLDVKDGELAWLTAEGRAELDKQDAIFINPWGLCDLPNHRINFFSDVIDKAQRGLDVVDLARRKIFQQIGAPEKHKGNAWIYKDASRLGRVLMIAWATHKPERCNPASFWDFGNSTHKEFCKTLKKFIKLDKGNGNISIVARKLLDQYREKSDQWEWVMDAFTDAFSLYARGSKLRDSVLETDFDAGLLKKRPQAFYVMVPDRYLDSHGQYLSNVLEYLVDTIANTSGYVRTTFLLDEFVNIPHVQSMVKALRLYRSKGVRLWIFAQDRDGYNKYKSEGGYKPFEESSVSLAWGVTGQHARDLSEIAGKRSVLIGTPSDSSGVSANTGGHSASEILVPNLPTSQISRDYKNKAILDTKEGVFVIERIPWWQIPWIRDYVRDPSKYPLPQFED